MVFNKNSKKRGIKSAIFCPVFTKIKLRVNKISFLLDSQVIARFVAGKGSYLAANP